jgi:uncharacterized protein YbjT (DUF2867 family)
MKVFVIGATGAIGGYAILALVRAAHSVTALARTPEKAARLSKQGASPITVSMFDRAATLTCCLPFRKTASGWRFSLRF